MNADAASPPLERLRGEVAAPPDKSISHRAALLGAMTDEPVRIHDYLDAADTNSTLAAVQQLGALVEERPDEVVVRGVGLREAREVTNAIDVGNAGTLMRLLPGWLAGQDGRRGRSTATTSIRARPIDRIAEPLRRMGASIEATAGRFPPFTVYGARLRAIAYDLPVASAQVKSCVLLAGLVADGATTVARADPLARPHRADARARPGVTIHRNGRRVTVANTDELELEDVARPGRSVVGGVRGRGGPARAGLAPAWSATSA